MEEIKIARKKKGWTQQQLADAIGVKRAVVSKYESGIISPSASTLQKIAYALDVEAASFFYSKTMEEERAKLAEEPILAQEAEREYWEDVILGEFGKTFMNYLEELNNEGQQKALERVQELTEIPRYQRQTEDMGTKLEGE